MGSKIAVIVSAMLLGAAALASATPSTEIWTPCTADIQPFRVWHLTYDTYFTVVRELAHGGQAMPIDLGLTVGVLPYERINLEVGFDWFEPTDDPVQLNLKLGTAEGKLGADMPGLAIGAYGLGTAKGVTDCNVVYGTVTRTLSRIGRLHLGYYRGNPDLLRDSQGRVDNRGVMAAWDRVVVKDRLSVAADWQQGENLFGAVAVGATYILATNAGLIVGYTFFNSAAINGKAKLTVQLDVNLR